MVKIKVNLGVIFTCIHAWSSSNLLLSSGQATKEDWAFVETSSPISRTAIPWSRARILLPGIGIMHGWLELPKSKVAFPASQGSTTKDPVRQNVTAAPSCQSNSFLLPALSQGSLHPKEYCDRHIRAENGQRTVFTLLNAKAREKQDCFWHWE